MMSVIQERIIILQNSVKILELILHKLGCPNKSFPTEKIQRKIRLYREELQLYKLTH